MYTAGAQHSSSRLSIWRPAHKRNHCFVLTSLVLSGLHQRSGVALPTGGRADPAVGNEALAGTRRSFFFSPVPGRRSLVPHTKTKTIFSTLKPRLVEHTDTDGFFFWDVPVSIRNSLRSNKLYEIAFPTTVWEHYEYVYY